MDVRPIILLSVSLVIACGSSKSTSSDIGGRDTHIVVVTDFGYSDVLEGGEEVWQDAQPEHVELGSEKWEQGSEDIEKTDEDPGPCEACGDCVNCKACGDGVCDATSQESCTTCPEDCGPCPTCGDKACDEPGEDCSTCPMDCGPCPETCGNGYCGLGETCSNCEQDCGPCGPVCPDGFCNGDETCNSCPQDCGPCPPYCGDNECNGTETCMSCPGDCGKCPDTCGDFLCSAGEDCRNCPQDCGECPPVLWFRSDWNETLDAPIVQGKKLRIRYDWDRLKDCRQKDENGFPAWMIKVFYTDDLAKPASSVEVVKHDENGQSWPVEPEIDIPASVQAMWFWANNTGPGDCIAWDSDFGKNYMMPVFAEAELSKPVGWMGWGSGGLDFAFVNEGGPISKGDQDPVYFFDSYLGGELTTAVRVQVYVAGITDRIYQNQAVAKEVAHTAVQAFVETDFAKGAGYPGAPFVSVPLEFEYQADNNFFYRWYFGSFGYVWYITDQGPPQPGVYSFRLAAKTANGEPYWIGMPGQPEKPRHLVYAQSPEQGCELFPEWVQCM